jgi:hypothetical protein
LEDIEKWESAVRETSDHLVGFNEMFRNATLSRVKTIQSQTSANYSQMIQAWSLREAYKANIEKKNESLTYLLQRASEGLIAAFPNEIEDPKAKKGAKGKK